MPRGTLPHKRPWRKPGGSGSTGGRHPKTFTVGTVNEPRSWPHAHRPIRRRQWRWAWCAAWAERGAGGLARRNASYDGPCVEGWGGGKEGGGKGRRRRGRRRRRRRQGCRASAHAARPVGAAEQPDGGTGRGGPRGARGVGGGPGGGGGGGGGVRAGGAASVSTHRSCRARRWGGGRSAVRRHCGRTGCRLRAGVCTRCPPWRATPCTSSFRPSLAEPRRSSRLPALLQAGQHRRTPGSGARPLPFEALAESKAVVELAGQRGELHRGP